MDQQYVTELKGRRQRPDCWSVRREGPQPGALAAGHDHGLHAGDVPHRSRSRSRRARRAMRHVEQRRSTTTAPGPGSRRAWRRCRRPRASRRVLSEARKSGKAIISRRVPALPYHVTSIRRTPMAARTSVPPATSTSRTRTATANQTGTRAVDEDAADGRRRTAAGRPPGRGPCPARTPGGSGGRCSRRGSRWRRARRAARRPRPGSSWAKSSHRNTGSRHSRTSGDDVRDGEDAIGAACSLPRSSSTRPHPTMPAMRTTPRCRARSPSSPGPARGWAPPSPAGSPTEGAHVVVNDLQRRRGRGGGQGDRRRGGRLRRGRLAPPSTPPWTAWWSATAASTCS